MLSAIRTNARRAPKVVAAAARPAAPARTAFRAGARRGYSTENAPAKTSYTLPIGLAAAALLGGGIWFYTSDDAGKQAETLGKEVKQVAKAATGFTPSKADYQKVYDKVVEILDSDESGAYDDGSYAPVLLRLAWHSSGTYDAASGTGGSNYATMRFEPESLHGANAGLQIARGVLEKVKQEFPWISYGDLWTLAGVAAVQEMGGPKVPWRPGRVDGFAKDATPDGRLPDASLGSDHVRNIFYRMGFNDQEIVALMGAHALGRCHRDRSGFDGPWTFSPTTMTNDFYKLLFSEKWVWRKWEGPKQLADKKTGSLMMLPTDYVMVSDKAFKKHAKAYADDEALFFKDFSAVIAKLFELGVPSANFVTSDPWFLGAEEKKA